MESERLGTSDTSTEMNAATRAVARNMFRLRVFESDGQGYQDLFIRVMRYADSDFRPVRPYGKLGDRGNDGYVREKGIFYQVYAPDEIRRRPNEAIKKLHKDFSTLRKFWKPFSNLREYHFVINDKYRGAPPHLEKALEGIRRRYRLEKCCSFGAAHLEDVLFSLAEDVIISIIGHVPVIDQNEFMFLSGLTYFVGAWIEFEKAARPLAQQRADSHRPLAGRLMIHELQHQGLVEQETAEFLTRMNGHRNRIVHGDSAEVPRKDEIDKIVSITSTLKARKRFG